MYNTITSVGFLAKDPEMRQTSTGKNVTTLRVGISPSQAKTKCYIDVVFWEKTAEIANQYLKKGREFLFTGELAMDTWEKDGQKRNKHYIVGRELKFLNSGKKEDGASGGGGQSNSGGDASNDDDIPF